MTDARGTTIRAPRLRDNDHTAVNSNTTTDQNSTEAQISTDARPLRGLTAFQRDLLRTIAALDEPHGLGIKASLERDYGGEEIHHGRLYPNLQTLCDKGLVEKGTIDRRTNSYTLTQRGRRELLAHRRWFCSAWGEM